MIGLVVRGPLGPAKEYRDFDVLQFSSIGKVLGLNLISILQVEPKDSFELFIHAVSRIRARVSALTIYHRGCMLPIPNDAELEKLFELLQS